MSASPTAPVVCPRCGRPAGGWMLRRPDNCGTGAGATCLRNPSDVLAAPVSRRPHRDWIAANRETWARLCAEREAGADQFVAEFGLPHDAGRIA